MKQKPKCKYDESTRLALAKLTGIDPAKFVTGQFTEADAQKIKGLFAKQADQAREKRAAFVALMAGALAGQNLDLPDQHTHPLDNHSLLIDLIASTIEDMWTEMERRNWL